MTQREIQLIEPSPRTSASQGEQPEKGPEAAWKVLIVDDDEMVCRVSARMLYESEVLTAESGEEACRLLETRAPQDVDCVLLDMKMPGLTFEQSFEEIRRIRPDIPVIACSGNTVDSLGDEFSAAPSTGFLGKPFTRAELKGAIDRAVSGPPLNG